MPSRKHLRQGRQLHFDVEVRARTHDDRRSRRRDLASSSGRASVRCTRSTSSARRPRSAATSTGPLCGTGKRSIGKRIRAGEVGEGARPVRRGSSARRGARRGGGSCEARAGAPPPRARAPRRGGWCRRCAAPARRRGPDLPPRACVPLALRRWRTSGRAHRSRSMPKTSWKIDAADAVPRERRHRGERVGHLAHGDGPERHHLARPRARWLRRPPRDVRPRGSRSGVRPTARTRDRPRPSRASPRARRACAR